MRNSRSLAHRMTSIRIKFRFIKLVDG